MRGSHADSQLAALRQSPEEMPQRECERKLPDAAASPPGRRIETRWPHASWGWLSLPLRPRAKPCCWSELNRHTRNEAKQAKVASGPLSGEAELNNDSLGVFYHLKGGPPHQAIQRFAKGCNSGPGSYIHGGADCMDSE